MNEFGKKLNELRLRKDLSLRDLAELSGLSYSFIGSLEKGRFKPSRDSVSSLAKALDADANELFLSAGFVPDEKHTVPQDLSFNPTSRDMKDLAKMLEQQEVMFHGTPLSEADKQRIMGFMESMFWEAKEMNKRKKKKNT